MRVYKFGGASVKDAAGVRNVANIIRSYSGKLVVVISAMGKTTNALEELTHFYSTEDKQGVQTKINEVRNYHLALIAGLSEDQSASINLEISELFDALSLRLSARPSLDYDFEYDQIVSLGEILSTKIVSAYLNQEGIKNAWLDIRHVMRTDSTWREANVNWALSSELVKKQVDFNQQTIYLTQGFIGSTLSAQTTTFGREGSDYTAAILANMLDAERVTVWKDVPGIMNADPNRFEQTQKLETLSYREAAEMTYYGAKVIHPKTMKPLVEKNIPLYVQSFLDPEVEGSVICKIDHVMNYVPVFISKDNLVLVTISPLDFSFIAEESISDFYRLLSTTRMKVDLVQQSAMNFSVALERPEKGFDEFIAQLKEHFVVRYNEGLELLTIRYYTDEVIASMTKDRVVYVSQRTRTAARFLMR